MLNTSSTMYIRIVPADRSRGYMLLVSWVKPVIQKYAVQVLSLSVLTRESLNATVESVRASYTPGSIVDVTPAGIQSQLRALFGEPSEKAKRPDTLKTDQPASIVD